MFNQSLVKKASERNEQRVPAGDFALPYAGIIQVRFKGFISPKDIVFRTPSVGRILAREEMLLPKVIKRIRQ
jgi:hypothetical protein